MSGSSVTLSAMRFGAPCGQGLRISDKCAPQFAAELRRMAEDIQAGKLWIEGASVESSLSGKAGSFVQTVVTLRFVETLEAPAG